MTTTTNYLLTKPTVGGDADAWGGYLNTDMDMIDAALSGIAAMLINGLTLSAAGSTATFGIAAGNAGDSSGRLMTLASAYTKTTSAWAVGTANGSLDTGAIANSTWYHVWLIKRVDTGVVDVLVSLSVSAPTMPTNYTLKRRIGSMKTDGSAQWVKFAQFADHFIWAVPVKDLDTGASVGSGNYTQALTGVPTGVNVVSRLRGLLANTTVGALINVYSMSETAALPNATRGNFVAAIQISGQSIAFVTDVMTDTSATIRYSVDQASSDIALDVYGWIDTRGR